ncbi:aspartate carbamoyltransferase regulatory subunit [Candidatus Micrarchaeota archaeon]|nr:aspartate carbamoyltransferase regulatory subunit [Candidatus Micrarchaeota archaeon]MBU1165719.1 aspartate carbamoyltransferase regulatory subunit [Candidatus Micrarchaeota archaeon]MBU1887086.1 aspartate carbamoyltransferase regulatory subunit [Candidatus Micrarchaeota archaeon]
MSTLNVDTIDMGTVVDHIKAGKGGKVLEILGIDKDYKHRIALVMNVASKKGGTKDIVKIQGKIVDDKTANLIALISPGATINIIKDEKVSKKFRVELPEKLDGLGTCPNPNCITNIEQCKNSFTKVDGANYRCHYCERKFQADELA